MKLERVIEIFKDETLFSNDVNDKVEYIQSCTKYARWTNEELFDIYDNLEEYGA